MKKNFVALVLAFVLALTMNVSVFAAENDYETVETPVSVDSAKPGEVLLDSFNLSAMPGYSDSDTFYVSGYNKYRIELVLFGPKNSQANVNITVPGGNTFSAFTGEVPQEKYTKSYNCYQSGAITVILDTWLSSPTGFVLVASVYGS